MSHIKRPIPAEIEARHFEEALYEAVAAESLVRNAT
jgi:hypothetical protein